MDTIEGSDRGRGTDDPRTRLREDAAEWSRAEKRDREWGQEQDRDGTREPEFER